MDSGGLAPPPTIPQNPYVNFASVTGVIGHTSHSVAVPVSPLRCLLLRQSRICVPRLPRYAAPVWGRGLTSRNDQCLRCPTRGLCVTEHRPRWFCPRGPGGSMLTL